MAPAGRRLIGAVVVAVVVVHVLWAASKPVTSDDLWWGMAAGRYITEHGTVPDRDVLSYTHTGAPWINGEWLSQVIEYKLYEYHRGLGVAVFKLALVLVVFAIVAWIAWRRAGSLVAVALVTMLTAWVCRPYFDLRSQLFLFLCMALTLAVIEAYRAAAAAWWVLALLPPIMVLWVNTHYSFLFGAGLLVLCACAELAKTWFGWPHDAMPRHRALLLGAAAVVTVSAVLLNPFGFAAVSHPFSIVGSETLWRQYIIEWTPPALFKAEDFNPAIFGYVLIGHIAVAIAACTWVRPRVDVTDAALFASTLVMALSARRFVPIFSLLAVPFTARNLVLLRDRFWRQRSGARGGATHTALALAAVLTSAATAIVLADAVQVVRMVRARGLFDVLVGGDYFPAATVEFLRENRMPGRVFHPYTWGGFLAFHIPDRQIFIDGRAHTVYPLEFYQAYLLVEHAGPGWNDVLDRWQIALVVWPEIAGHGTHDNATLEQLRNAAAWKMIYSDGRTAVFAHTERGRSWIDAFEQTRLVYPDLPEAQLFVAIAQWNADNFSAAHQYFAAAMRIPDGKAATHDAEQTFVRAAHARDAPRAWFNVGFFRELNGDREGAAQAFARALEKGLSGANLTAYAHMALERLGSERQRDDD